MNATKSVVLVIAVLFASSATGQVVPPRQALGEAPATGRAASYSTMVPLEPYRGANCSPSRVSMIFSPAIRSGAARVWCMRVGADTYAVIWRRDHDSYRAVQLVEARSGRVGQKTVGKHVYQTKQDAADAIAEHVQKRIGFNEPPQIAMAGHRPNLDVARRAGAAH
jgi:hypothetical protein